MSLLQPAESIAAPMRERGRSASTTFASAGFFAMKPAAVVTIADADRSEGRADVDLWGLAG
jgi:hypothetical protein